MGEVTVESVGAAGIFDYVVLSATEPNALNRWLQENRFEVPADAVKAFEPYVKGGWHWLAMRVRPEAALTGTLAPHPIAYTYKADKLVYPMIISKPSADTSNEVLLYVISTTGYMCSNWTNRQFDSAALSRLPAADPGKAYADSFDTQTRDAGGRLFITEYADLEWKSTLQEKMPTSLGLPAGGASTPGGRPLDVLHLELLGQQADRPVVTRLRAVMAPGVMDRDVELIPQANWGRVGYNIYVAEGAAPAAMAAPLAMFGLLWGGTVLARRRSWRRGAGILLIVLACGWFATM